MIWGCSRATSTTAADDNDLGRDLRQLRDGPLDHRLPADGEEGLIPTEAGALTPGKDDGGEGRGDHWPTLIRHGAE